jgi:hypothetical protein
VGSRRRGRTRKIEQSSPEGALVCFSVRSSFELLLDALALPPGSEVVMSAITHPDMCRIVSRHELVPIPVELDLEALQPRLDLLEQALTSRTRAMVLAHLFGARTDIAPVIAFCRAHGLVLIEDCAQTLRGPDDAGDPETDVAPPPDRPWLRPEKSIRFMEQVVFVPVYPELPEGAFRRLLETLRRLEDERLGEPDVGVEPGETVRR